MLMYVLGKSAAGPWWSRMLNAAKSSRVFTTQTLSTALLYAFLPMSYDTRRFVYLRLMGQVSVFGQLSQGRRSGDSVSPFTAITGLLAKKFAITFWEVSSWRLINGQNGSKCR